MNCAYFQNRVYEYVDETLSPAAQSAAGRHLACCEACRQVLRREQLAAQFLSEHLRRDAEALVLRPEALRHILGTVAAGTSPSTPRESFAGFWTRFAWPLGVAFAVLLVAGTHIHKMTAARSNPATVSIQISFRVPVPRFREQGNYIVDTMSYQTVVAGGTLRNPAQPSVH